jgi:hypothetical protein
MASMIKLGMCLVLQIGFSHCPPRFDMLAHIDGVMSLYTMTSWILTCYLICCILDTILVDMGDVLLVIDQFRQELEDVLFH